MLNVSYGNSNWNAHVFDVIASGYIDDWDVNNSNGVRPC